MDLLTPTDRVTAYPYKGTARYWSAAINGATHEDIIWGYDGPVSRVGADRRPRLLLQREDRHLPRRGLFKTDPDEVLLRVG